MSRLSQACDRMQGQFVRGSLIRPAACLLAMLPLLAACDSLLDAAGLARESRQDLASAPPESTGGRVSGSRSDKLARESSKRISDAQRMLNGLGHDAGPADGIMGPRTEAAIRDFQAAANLPVDGRISPGLTATLLRKYEDREKLVDAAGPALATSSRIALLAEPATQNERVAFREMAGPRYTAAGTTTTRTGVSPKSRLEQFDGIAPEPYYETGDQYVYSNGRIETVARIEDGMVHWTASDGSRYTAARNFVMPPVKWENRHGVVESIEVSSSGVFWPPARTDALVYSANTVDLNANRHLHEAWSGEWRCGAGNESMLAVPAGTFLVVEITCETTSRTPGEWRRRVWYYAPELRHFVRKKDMVEVGGVAATVELVAIRPDRSNWTRAARSGFNWAVRKLLDRGAVGDKIEWTVADSGIELEIVLTGELQTADNVFCRRYTVVRVKPDDPRILPVLACRDGANGGWVVPGFEKEPILAAEELASKQ